MATLTLGAWPGSQWIGEGLSILSLQRPMEETIMHPVLTAHLHNAVYRARRKTDARPARTKR